MAAIFEQPRNGTLFLGGQKISGADIRDQNGWCPPSRHLSVNAPPSWEKFPYRAPRLIMPTVLATQAIANVVKSSFGPSGLDKMMVDDIGVRPALNTTPQPCLLAATQPNKPCRMSP